MKKVLYSIFALALVCGATSCKSDEEKAAEAMKEMMEAAGEQVENSMNEAGEQMSRSMTATDEGANLGDMVDAYGEALDAATELAEGAEALDGDDLDAYKDAMDASVKAAKAASKMSKDADLDDAVEAYGAAADAYSALKDLDY